MPDANGNQMCPGWLWLGVFSPVKWVRVNPARLSAWGWVGIIPDRAEELMESSSEEKDWGETALDGVWAAWAGGGHPAHSRGGAEGALGSPTQLRCDSVAL